MVKPGRAGTLLLDGPSSIAAWGRPSTLTMLAGLGLLSTVVPTTAYAIASSRIPSVVATSIRMLTPLMATGRATVLLRELPSWRPCLVRTRHIRFVRSH